MPEWNNIEELVSFMVASQPCPPLPLIAHHQESSESRAASSHDLLFRLIQKSYLHSPNLPEDTKLRMKRRKLELLRGLEDQLVELDTGRDVEDPPSLWTPESAERVYRIFCGYFRDFAAVYTFNEVNDLRFRELHETRGCSRMAGLAARHFDGLRDLTRMDCEEWDRHRLPVLNIPAPGMARYGYEFVLCLHAHKVRLERAGII